MGGPIFILKMSTLIETVLKSYAADAKVYYFLKRCIPFKKLLIMGCMIYVILKVISTDYCLAAFSSNNKTTIAQICRRVTPHLIKKCIPICIS